MLADSLTLNESSSNFLHARRNGEITGQSVVSHNSSTNSLSPRCMGCDDRISIAMFVHRQPRNLFLIAIAALAVLLTDSCRNRAQSNEGDVNPETASEPDQYSSTIVRTVEDGTTSEAHTLRESRSGNMRRQEWTEQGQSRALILRPDLGTSYLLDLDRQLYVEVPLATARDDSDANDRAKPDSTNSFVESVDRAIDDAPSPDRVETRTLPAELIAGHSCKVYERRASFPDGHTEITRTFRAADLNGLALKIEAESVPPTVRVITERRDFILDVRADAFTLPASFKKVEKLTP